MSDHGFPMKVESLQPTLKVTTYEAEWVWLGAGPEPTFGRLRTWLRSRLVFRRRLWRWWELLRIHVLRRSPLWRMKDFGDYFPDGHEPPDTELSRRLKEIEKQ